MKIQSCSIVSPAGCPMDCLGCVSQMHRDSCPNLIRADRTRRAMHEKNYIRRLAFARDNGCNTAVITGDGEPMADLNFLDQFAKLNWALSSPFRWIEIQTSGAYVTPDTLAFLRDTVGVSTISLSVWDLFDDTQNMMVFQCPEKLRYKLDDLCAMIVEAGMNLRLSVNMTQAYEDTAAFELFKRVRELGADQLTLRRLYANEYERDIKTEWVRKNAFDLGQLQHFRDYIKSYGKLRGYLSFGAAIYALQNLSIVLDEDCMSQQAKEELKYVVLRPNCKLYRDWENTLMF